ncbi:hypothetical protein L6452_21967 [Arctium lappa]|uniref:Uncharacterized protein n=1 Tax=Arctium lappa TaxID=4217 RepID=A0ACB9AXN9_ARCLA|nr:hypothetical protein L6452_21967 [Arctium lappa]
MDDIAKTWRILSGITHWLGLLDPPPPVLRRYVIHYGEMAEATYDAYNKVSVSKNAGNCRYARKNLLSRVGLVEGHPLSRYDVTKYIYATSAVILPGAFVNSDSKNAWSKKSNWIGFVAVATDEGKKALGRRDIMVAWRGTSNASDMIHDIEFPFRSENIWEGHVLSEVKRLVNQYRLEEISLSITGHSMGAAVATLNAVDIVINGLNRQSIAPLVACPVTVFGFASPGVGDSNFNKVFTLQRNLHCMRVQNVLDLVPKYPPVGYKNVGSQMTIDSMKSEYIKGPGNPGSWHSLEGYLHGIAGTQGTLGGFKLEVNRDISLVNKFTDDLKPEHGVPGSWWTEKNVGMVQKKDGTWELQDQEDLESEP